LRTALGDVANEILQRSIASVWQLQESDQ